MQRYGKAKITQYNEKGKELQEIQQDINGQELCSDPLYITDNINWDICVSE
jgi:hypothetical protein